MPVPVNTSSDLAPATDASMLAVMTGRTDLNPTASKTEKKRNPIGIDKVDCKGGLGGRTSCD